MKKKILMISLGKDYGGAEKLIENIVKNSEDDKFILVISKKSGFSKKGKIPQNIKVIEVENNLKNIVQNITKISKIIKNEKCNIIHSHGTPSNLISILIKELCRVKMITTIHSDLNYDFSGNKLKVYKAIEKLTILKANRVITVSKDLKNKLEKRAWGKKNNIETIYNRINFEENLNYKKNMDDEIRLLSIGRLEEVKNIELSIDILRKLKERGNKIFYTIVGEGSSEKILKEKVVRLGLEEDVQFLGYRTDVKKIMNENDILILTSKMEGIPITIIEGFATKMIVIATNVGGIPEMIIDGQNGILIEESLEKSTEKIERIIKNKEKLEEIKEKAFKTYEKNWKMKNVFEEYIEVYERI